MLSESQGWGQLLFPNTKPTPKPGDSLALLENRVRCKPVHQAGPNLRWTWAAWQWALSPALIPAWALLSGPFGLQSQTEPRVRGSEGTPGPGPRPPLSTSRAEGSVGVRPFCAFHLPGPSAFFYNRCGFTAHMPSSAFTQSTYPALPAPAAAWVGARAEEIGCALNSPPRLGLTILLQAWPKQCTHGPHLGAPQAGCQALPSWPVSSV